MLYNGHIGNENKQLRFIEQIADLVALVEREEQGWLDGICERIMSWRLPISVHFTANSAKAVTVRAPAYLRSDRFCLR